MPLAYDHLLVASPSTDGGAYSCACAMTAAASNRTARHAEAPATRRAQTWAAQAGFHLALPLCAPRFKASCRACQARLSLASHPTPLQPPSRQPHRCGSLLAPLSRPAANADVTSGLVMGGVGAGGAEAAGARVVCPVCEPGSACAIERVALPYVFRFLATELAAMNIKLQLEVK